MSPMKLVLRRSRATMAKKRTKKRHVHAKLFFLTLLPLDRFLSRCCMQLHCPHRCLISQIRTWNRL